MLSSATILKTTSMGSVTFFFFLSISLIRSCFHKENYLLPLFFVFFYRHVIVNSISPSVYPSINPVMYLSTYLFQYPSINPYIHLFSSPTVFPIMPTSSHLSLCFCPHQTGPRITTRSGTERMEARVCAVKSPARSSRTFREGEHYTHSVKKNALLKQVSRLCQGLTCDPFVHRQLQQYALVRYRITVYFESNFNFNKDMSITLKSG
jgi:hypothetical protein